MKRLTDANYWSEAWWKREGPRRLWLYRDYDFEMVALLHRAAGHKPARVLEVGAGGSRVLPYLARQFGYQVVGTDFSMAGCLLLRANLALQGQRGAVVCEDFFYSSLRPEGFDLVYSSGLIEHFDDTRAAVVEHLRHVKPGGRLVLIVPNLQGIQGKIWRRLAPPFWEKHWVITPAVLEACLKDLGLESVRWGYVSSFFIHVGLTEEWTAVRRWPRLLQILVHLSVRLLNGLISFFFRWSPLRPHSRALSHAFFALGTKPSR